MQKADGIRWTSLERKEEPVYAQIENQGWNFVFRLAK